MPSNSTVWFLLPCCNPYYEYDYTALLLEASVALSAVYNIKNELYEEVYRLHDDVDGEWYYYVEHEAALTVATLS